MGRPLFFLTAYFSGTSGRTAVPSDCTAVNDEGFSPRACRMVGATWAVPTSARTVTGERTSWTAAE